MKKLLLTVSLFSLAIGNAQVLRSDDFNGLTLGDIGTDISGVTPGQDGWLTFATNGAAPTTGTNAANSNFQIVAAGFGGTQGVMITGSDGNKGSRFLWKDGLAALFDTRTTGNDVAEVEYDMFTGGATSSTAQFGARLYGLEGTTSRVMNGFVYNANTRILQGVSYLNNAGTYGTYLITLQTGGLILDADTWYRIGFSYDTATGETIWKASTVYTGLPAANWVSGMTIDELDLVGGTPTTNAAVTTLTFDNLSFRASAQEDLLGTNEVVGSISSFDAFPNPAKDVLNVYFAQAQNATIQLIDTNGRVVKQVTMNVTEGQINISDLNSGVYIMNVTSELGTFNKKIVKE